jgi:sec-independent protein translocase protein TatA
MDATPNSFVAAKSNRTIQSMQLDPMLAIFNLGGGEVILILAIALILFGAKRLPGLARGLGQGIKEFKKSTGASPAGMPDSPSQGLEGI